MFCRCSVVSKISAPRTLTSRLQDRSVKRGTWASGVDSRQKAKPTDGVLPVVSSSLSGGASLSDWSFAEAKFLKQSIFLLVPCPGSAGPFAKPAGSHLSPNFAVAPCDEIR